MPIGQYPYWWFEPENIVPIEWESDEERHDGYDLTLIEQEAVTAIEREAGIELVPGELGIV